ncbi:hypothetical protein ACFFV7_44405 [Nonomuraea spiralis]|uniref:Uncharacterized protein n=1 Tax=Nonomuraea spiralis TaxID=46182 RepID=A0ABV5IX32_9ACTN|nr:hypothetical protein [Nonomuraea spiralis]GGT47078.1 hypothetical protein GCM10010176_107450 [Nonomuraea spiralis]
MAYGATASALVRKWAAGERSRPACPAGSRHSPLATVLSDFYHDLQSERRKTPYPLEEIRQVAGRHALPLE